MAASHSVCASMKTKVDSTIAFMLTCCGTTVSNCAPSIQRMRKERQNSSSITGTSSAAPAQRTAISDHSSWPSASTGLKLAVGSPKRSAGRSRWIHSTNTTSPTPTASAASRRFGRFWRASSPYSDQ